MLVVEEVVIRTGGTYDAVDLTPLVSSFVKKYGIRKGSVLIYSVDPLCPIFTIEFEPKLLSDLVKYVKGLSSSEEDARLLASTVLGCSLVVPVVNGSIAVASFQQITLMELNEKGGSRKVCVVVQGE